MNEEVIFISQTLKKNTQNPVRLTKTPGKRQEHNLGMLAMALCALLWSSGGLLIKFIDAHPLAIAGGRSLLALLVLWLAVGKPRFTGSFPQIGAGVMNALTMILFIASNKLTTSANAILLQYAAPVYVAVLAAVFLKEKLRPRDLITLGVVLTGVILFFSEQVSPGNLLGNILATLSGLSFAVFFVLMRKQKDKSTIESFIISHLLTVLISLPFWGHFTFSLQNGCALALLGFFQIGFASILFSYGIKRAPALNAVLIATIEPILNPVWVFLVTSEKPTRMALVGGALILLAVLVLQLIDTLKARQESI